MTAETGRAHQLLRSVVLAALAIVVSWLFGHLPWVFSGFSWPTTEAVPVGSSSAGLAGVRLTIPLVASFLSQLVAFTLVGATAAGLLPLAFPHLPRWPATLLAVLSAAGTVLVVTLLARSSIRHHAADAFAGDDRVLRGLVLVVVAATAVGLLLGAAASVQPGLLPVATAVIAGQAPAWLHGFLLGGSHGIGAVRLLDQISHVVVLVLMAAAFVLSVRRSARWALLWPVAVAILWTAAPFGVMTAYLAGTLRPSAGLPGSLREILEAGVDYFRASYWHTHQTWWPWAVALAIGLVWLVIGTVRRRTGR